MAAPEPIANLRRVLRSAAPRGALAAAATLVMVAGLRGVLDLWWLAAAAVATAAGALLGRAREREPGPATVAGSEEGRTAADTVLANIPDPVILVDRRAVVRQANEAARALLPSLKLDHPLSFFLRAPDVLDGVAEAVRTGLPLKVAYDERIPTERAFEVQIGPLIASHGEAGTEAGVVLFFRDQTSARRLERMRVDFVANASHELRTPLASLHGFIETLQGPARGDAAARERFLEIMRGQAQRMSRLIEDLLSLSRIELRAHVPPESALDLLPLVRQMIDAMAPLAREHAVEIAFSAPNGPLMVAGDRDELLRVVENLIENAVKYGGTGKRIEVELAPRQPAERRPVEVELVVRDYGPGIAPEHLPRLTERFYRADVVESRQKGGTGLGLAIVKHIVARHGGRLAIESEFGRGATFRVTLPALPGRDPQGNA
jgi:two-component system, OmpR family, phosphate regulon sensor histidine kinase PhoR